MINNQFVRRKLIVLVEMGSEMQRITDKTYTTHIQCNITELKRATPLIQNNQYFWGCFTKIIQHETRTS